MLWTPQSPAPTPTRSPLRSPFPLPVSLHPSCVLALLPQNDDKWFDYSGHGNHGIVHGATPTAKGPDGFAWEFDPVNAFIDCGNHVSLQPTKTVTMAFSIKISSYPITPNLHMIGFHTHHGYAFWLWAAGGVPILWIVEIPPISGTGRQLNIPLDLIPLNTWTHIVAAIDTVNKTIRVYQNRALFIEMSILPGDITFFGPFQIRPRTHSLIDYLSVYNQAWSPRPQDANYLPEIDPHLT